MPRRKQTKDVTKRCWSSLTALKDFLETSKQEKVVSFDGFALTTETRVYTLYDGQLTATDR